MSTGIHRSTCSKDSPWPPTSWACPAGRCSKTGVAPGLDQSGERDKPARTRHGEHWLTGALGFASMAANRTQDTTFLDARYRRLARRIGKPKALVAIQHSMLTAVWHVISENTNYHDLGGDHYAKRDPNEPYDALPGRQPSRLHRPLRRPSHCLFRRSTLRKRTAWAPNSNVTPLGRLGDPPSPRATNRHMAVVCGHLAEQIHDIRCERDVNDFAIPVAPTRGTLSC